MRTALVSSIMSAARLYADARPGGSNAHVTDTELLGLVNAACAEYWDLLIKCGGQNLQGLSTETFISSSLTLPPDYYQLLSLHIQWGTNDLEDLGAPLDNVADRDYWVNQNSTWERGSPKAWWIEGGAPPTLAFAPTIPTNKTLILKYIPHWVDREAADTILTIDAWDKYIALVVACELRTIMGLPNTFLVKLRDEQRARIEDMAGNRRMLPSKIRLVDEKESYTRRRRLPRGW